MDQTTFEIDESVIYLHRGSSRSKTFEVPATIKEVHPKGWYILIDGQSEKKFVEKRLNKLRKLE